MMSGPVPNVDVQARVESQRRINLIWETTQALIAVGVVGTNLIAAFYPSEVNQALLGNAFFLVIGFYFGRTNHIRPLMANRDETVT